MITGRYSVWGRGTGDGETRPGRFDDAGASQVDLASGNLTFTKAAISNQPSAFSFRKSSRLTADGSRLVFDEDGRWSRSVDTEGYVRSAQTDFVSRTTKYVDANGNALTYGYNADGAKTLFVDGEGNKVEWVRDANKNVLEQRRLFGGQAPAVDT